MNAQLFINETDEKTVIKKLTPAGAEFSLDFLDASDIIRPVVKIKSDKLDGQVNYIKLIGLGRFYFIRKFTMDQGYITMELEEDVLMSWHEDLYKQTCVITRCETGFNNYLVDPKTKTYNSRSIKTIEFPKGFDKDTQEFVMGVVGNTTL